MENKTNNFSGKKIAKYRNRKHMTQAELGKIVGLSSTAISNYETGYSTPRTDKLMKIAEALDINIKYLLDDDPVCIEKLNQTGYSYNSFPYFANFNIKSPEDIATVMADCYAEIPTEEKHDTSEVFYTNLKDNAMENNGLIKGSIVFIKKDVPLHTGNIVALIDKKNKCIIARTYSKEGPVVRLLPNSNSDYEPIVTMENDSDYIIIGTVVAKILKLDFFDENNY